MNLLQSLVILLGMLSPANSKDKKPPKQDYAITKADRPVLRFNLPNRSYYLDFGNQASFKVRILFSKPELGEYYFEILGRNGNFVDLDGDGVPEMGNLEKKVIYFKGDKPLQVVPIDVKSLK